MIALLWVVAIGLMVAGLVGIVAPALPGPPLVYAGILVLAAAYRFDRISILTLVLLGLVTLVLVALDVAASAWGAKTFGGTWRGAAGAAVGGLVGMFWGPIGLLLGSLLGAAGCELIGGKTGRESLKAGGGAVIGLLAGAVVKGVACVAMIASALVAHFS